MPFDYTFSFNSSNKEDPKNVWSWGYKEEFVTGKIIELLRQRQQILQTLLLNQTLILHVLHSELQKQRLLHSQ